MNPSLLPSSPPSFVVISSFFFFFFPLFVVLSTFFFSVTYLLSLSFRPSIFHLVGRVTAKSPLLTSKESGEGAGEELGEGEKVGDRGREQFLLEVFDLSFVG